MSLRQTLRQVVAPGLPAAAAALCIIATSPAAPTDGSARNQYRGNPPLTLLSEFHPVGANGNNLQNPALDPVPGAAELAIAPLDFAAGTNDGLVTAPNARLISNVIAGGTGFHDKIANPSTR
jgi:hypothetical protein